MKFGEYLEMYDSESTINEDAGFDMLLDEAIDELKNAYENNEDTNELVEKVIKIKLSKYQARKMGKKFKFSSDKEGFKVVKKPGTDGKKASDFQEVKMTPAEIKMLQKAATKRAKSSAFQTALAKGRAKAARVNK